MVPNRRTGTDIKTPDIFRSAPNAAHWVRHSQLSRVSSPQIRVRARRGTPALGIATPVSTGHGVGVSGSTVMFRYPYPCGPLDVWATTVVG